MQKDLPINAIVCAFQALDPAANVLHLENACKRLVMNSDLVNCATIPFSLSEQDAIATAIFQYVTQPSDLMHPCREIVFERTHPLVGQVIEYDEFASIFSADFLSQNYSLKYDKASHIEKRDNLGIFLCGMLFRYTYCSHSDLCVFRVSVIFDYIEATRVLFPNDNSDSAVLRVLYATLKALRSLEYRAYPAGW